MEAALCLRVKTRLYVFTANCATAALPGKVVLPWSNCIRMECSSRLSRQVGGFATWKIFGNSRYIAFSWFLFLFWRKSLVPVTRIQALLKVNRAIPSQPYPAFR